jgi:hypothetical protein
MRPWWMVCFVVGCGHPDALTLFSSDWSDRDTAEAVPAVPAARALAETGLQACAAIWEDDAHLGLVSVDVEEGSGTLMILAVSSSAPEECCAYVAEIEGGSVRGHSLGTVALDALEHALTATDDVSGWRIDSDRVAMDQGYTIESFHFVASTAATLLRMTGTPLPGIPPHTPVVVAGTGAESIVLDGASGEVLMRP